MEAPVLDESLSLFIMCYMDMRRGRDVRQSPTWADVQAWCNTYGLNACQAVAMHEATIALDVKWRELHPKKEGEGNG